MKKLIILIMTGALTIIVPTSCEDFLTGYLDKAPEQGLPEEQIFTKLTNFKLFFDAVYLGQQTQAGNWSGGWRDYNIKYCFPWYWDAWDQKYSSGSVTDESDMGRYMEGHAWKSGNMSETIVNKMTYDGSRNPVLWSCFLDIRISNIALQKVDLIEDATDAEKDDLRAQAYFVRALCHFTLFTWWGPMPYLTDAIGPEDPWDIPRLTAWETCTKIAADFDSAYMYFEKAGLVRRDPPLGVPNHLAYAANQMYRPNGMVAKAWKAKALMFAASPQNNKNGVSDWQVAAAASWDALKLALDQGLFLLPANLRYLNFYGAEATDESLWTYLAGTLSWSGGSWSNQTNRGYGATFMNGIFGASTGSYSGISPTQNWVDKYETIFGEPLNTQADRDAATLAGHYNEQDPYANRDPRLLQDVIYNQGPCVGWQSGKAQLWYQVSGGVTSYSELLNPTFAGRSRTGYYQRKVWWNNSTKNRVSSIWSHPLCRLAECYLQYAECSNEAYGPTAIGVSGATISALDAINAIRTRAGMPNVIAAYTVDKDAFRPRIKNERNIELSFEGHYYPDLCRWLDLKAAREGTLYGMIPEKVSVSAEYPTGFKYVREPLSADRQPAWKPQMYYLPFNNADALKMTKFVPNPVW